MNSSQWVFLCPKVKQNSLITFCIHENTERNNVWVWLITTFTFSYLKLRWFLKTKQVDRTPFTFMESTTETKALDWDKLAPRMLQSAFPESLFLQGKSGRTTGKSIKNKDPLTLNSTARQELTTPLWTRSAAIPLNFPGLFHFHLRS